MGKFTFHRQGDTTYPEQTLEYQQGYQRGFIEGSQEGLKRLAEYKALEIPTIEIEISGNDAFRVFAQEADRLTKQLEEERRIRMNYQRALTEIMERACEGDSEEPTCVDAIAREVVWEKFEEPLPFTDIEGGD